MLEVTWKWCGSSNFIWRNFLMWPMVTSEGHSRNRLSLCQHRTFAEAHFYIHLGVLEQISLNFFFLFIKDCVLFPQYDWLLYPQYTQFMYNRPHTAVNHSTIVDLNQKVSFSNNNDGTLKHIILLILWGWNILLDNITSIVHLIFDKASWIQCIFKLVRSIIIFLY